MYLQLRSKGLAIGMACALASAVAQAVVSETEAARLGKDLTPVGAERAGNADNSIPAWDGGMTAAPSGWKPGQPRPNPVANEKPLFSIDEASADKYRERLTPGQYETLKKFSGHRMDVYPTHRSCGYPEWYYERTHKNATFSKLADNGWGLGESMGAAVPFPIPKTGYEVIWNHKLRWEGEGYSTKDYHVIVPPARSKSLGPAFTVDEQVTSPMWDRKVNSVVDAKGVENYFWNVITTPPAVAGDQTVAISKLAEPTDLWLYFASQRRVRRAPTYQYDAPLTGVDNMMVVDQFNQFSGPMDRFDFKLVGKKEIYIPYNNYPLYAPAKVEDLATATGFKPEKMRYELHRVWVVDATVKSGVRHTFSRRTMYVDEDSWSIMAQDLYDMQGKLWRSMEGTLIPAVEIPACVSKAYSQFDLQVGRFMADRVYLNTDWLAAREGRIKASRFSADGMRRNGD